jgi:hypothetical protein
MWGERRGGEGRQRRAAPCATAHRVAENERCRDLRWGEGSWGTGGRRWREVGGVGEGARHPWWEELNTRVCRSGGKWAAVFGSTDP